MRCWYLLALQFGMPVAALKASMPAAEVPYWFALYELDPWGEQRADLRQAITTSAIANTMGGAKSKPADFMPYMQEQKQKQTPEQQTAILHAWIAEVEAATKQLNRGNNG